MTCQHGNKPSQCVKCYRELAAERGRRILEQARANEQLRARIAELEAQARVRVPEGNQ